MYPDYLTFKFWDDVLSITPNLVHTPSCCRARSMFAAQKCLGDTIESEQQMDRQGWGPTRTQTQTAASHHTTDVHILLSTDYGSSRLRERTIAGNRLQRWLLLLRQMLRLQSRRQQPAEVVCPDRWWTGHGRMPSQVLEWSLQSARIPFAVTHGHPPVKSSSTIFGL